jgi:hypothetical protein
VSRSAGPEVVRYATRGVRFPRLVGRTLDGTRLPGGPYTVTQVVGAACVLAVGAFLRPLWGGEHMIFDYALLLGVAAGVGYCLQWLPVGGRSPWDTAVGLKHLLRTPSNGRLNDRAVRWPRPTWISGPLTPLLIPLPAQAVTTCAPDPALRVADGPRSLAEPPTAPPLPLPLPPARPGGGAVAGTQHLTHVGQLLAALAQPDPTTSASAPRPSHQEQ